MLGHHSNYNCLEFLPLAVASVRMQGIEDIEILVVDDASIDGTAEWLTAETARDPRLIPLHTERKGPSYTRNLALYQARAPIVGFLDADDLWWPNKLARALRFHEARPDVGFSFTDYLAASPEGEVRGTCFDYWRPGYVDRRSCDFSIVPDAELELLAVNVVGTSTVVGFARGVAKCEWFCDWGRVLRRTGTFGCDLRRKFRSPARPLRPRPI